MSVSPEPGHVPVLRFSTEAFAPNDRLDAWSSMLGGTYAIDAEPGGFHAEISAASVDRMVVINMDTAAQSLTRSSAQIRRDGLERVSLHFSRHGYRFVSAKGEGRMEGGEISINDLSRPFQRSAAAETSSVVVSLSRDLVDAVLPNSDNLHGTVVSGSACILLSEHMRMLGHRIGELPCAVARPLAEATAAMLAVALGGARRSLEPALPAFDAARLLRAKRHIRAHLHEPSLTPDAIARALHLSRSKLFALFEPEGGVERYILHRRLAAVAEALRDPRDARPIAQIAYASGFASAPHFSRAFRARYGLTPSEMRLGWAAGRPSDLDAGQSALAEWLRRLG